LGLSVNEKKAFQCKIVCLIHLDKFDEALSLLERIAEGADLYFERAYCEYRLNKLEQAYQTLRKCSQFTNKERELMAQITYKLEKFQESFDSYRDLIKNIDDEFDAERQTNLSAVVASLKQTNPASNKDLDMSENENRTYELCYNSACIQLAKGQTQEAYDKLKKAEKMCVETLNEDAEQAEDQEAKEFLDNEVAIIKVQLAYCLQRMSKNEEALKIYNQVSKTKPSDLR
jgi:signal recognition particle subunit SRP72